MRLISAHRLLISYFKLFHNTATDSIPLAAEFDFSVGFEINLAVLYIVPFATVLNKGGVIG